jgi:hypothetical protein
VPTEEGGRHIRSAPCGDPDKVRAASVGTDCGQVIDDNGGMLAHDAWWDALSPQHPLEQMLFGEQVRGVHGQLGLTDPGRPGDGRDHRSRSTGSSKLAARPGSGSVANASTG